MPRPVTYDRDAVIEMAALQFWEDGFGDCDVETLTRRAKLNRHSLYKAFGGKTGLFLDSLEFYIGRVAAPYIALLEGGSDLDDLVEYFDTVSGNMNRRDARAGSADIDGYDTRGCFITNTVTELGRSDPRVAAIIDRYYERFADAFAALVARGQASGSIRADLDPQAIGRWLLLTSQGMSVAARLGNAMPDVSQIVRAALAAPPRTS